MPRWIDAAPFMRFAVYFGTGSQVAPVVKNLPANAGDLREVGSIPVSGRSPGGEHDNPLWSSCLENPMERRAWQATVHSVAQSWTQLMRRSMHAQLNKKSKYEKF